MVAAEQSTKEPEFLIAVSIKRKDKREGLFKFIDKPEYAHEVIDRTASKRVITHSLFDRLQSKIDAYPRCRVSLLGMNENDELEVYSADCKPMSPEYDSILRRIRF